MNDAESAPYAEPDLPMKWHKFQIYFTLWLNAAAFWLAGVMLMSGTRWGDRKTVMYAFYPIVQVVEILLGVLLIAVGVAALHTRFALAHFRANGPKMLTAMYLVGYFFPIFQALVLSIATNQPPAVFMNGYPLRSLIRAVFCAMLWVVVNCIYYKRRAHLFVH